MVRNTKAKGSQYEREICHRLSLWWTYGKDDDIFWRSSSSGGRATQRAKKNKTTHGNCGDMQATNPIGKALIRTIAIEIKRGYRNGHIGECLDKPIKTKPSEFEKFVTQAIESARIGNCPYWMVIHKRDRREELIYVPIELITALPQKSFVNFTAAKIKSLRLQSKVVCVLWLSEFLEKVTSREIKELYQHSFRW